MEADLAMLYPQAIAAIHLSSIFLLPSLVYMEENYTVGVYQRPISVPFFPTPHLKPVRIFVPVL